MWGIVFSKETLCTIMKVPWVFGLGLSPAAFISCSITGAPLSKIRCTRALQNFRPPEPRWRKSRSQLSSGHRDRGCVGRRASRQSSGFVCHDCRPCLARLNGAPCPAMADRTPSIQRAEQVDHQLVRGIGIPALTANIVSSTIGAGIFVIPATVAAGLGPAAPLAFICCAIAMVLFVTCFAIAGSRVSLTGGLYAYVEAAFGKYVGFLARPLYFLTALGAVAGVVNVLATSVALVIPFLGGPIMRIVVMLAVYGSLVLINIRGVRQGAGAVTVITVAKLLPLLLFVSVGIFFIHA